MAKVIVLGWCIDGRRMSWTKVNLPLLGGAVRFSLSGAAVLVHVCYPQLPLGANNGGHALTRSWCWHGRAASVRFGHLAFWPDDQLKLSRLLKGHINHFGTYQQLRDLTSTLTKYHAETGTIRNQAAFLSPFGPLPNGRQPTKIEAVTDQQMELARENGRRALS